MKKREGTVDLKLTQKVVRIKDSVGNTLGTMRMSATGELLIYPAAERFEVLTTLSGALTLSIPRQNNG